jgi:hypothetical protein
MPCATAPCFRAHYWQTAFCHSLSAGSRFFPASRRKYWHLAAGCDPGTPIALLYTRKTKTRLAFAATMAFVLSVASIAMTPLAIEAVPETVHHSEQPILLVITNVAVSYRCGLVCGRCDTRRNWAIGWRCHWAC